MVAAVVVGSTLAATPAAADLPGPGDADLLVTLTTGGQPVDAVEVLLCTDVTTYGADCIADSTVVDQGDGTAVAEFTGVAQGTYTAGVVASWLVDPYYRDFHTYEIGPVTLGPGLNLVSSTVPTGGRVTGTVYAPGGVTPAPFATLSFSPDPDPSWPYSVFQIVGFPTIIADGNGQFTTDAFPLGDYTVAVLPGAPGQGAAYRETSVSIAAGPAGTLDPVLLPGGGVVGTVTDAVTGNPVDGASVQAYQGSGDLGTYAIGYTDFDGLGTYELGDVVPSTDYFVAVSAPGYARQVVSPVDVTAGVNTTVNVQLELGATVTGTVFDGDGAVVPYADVFVSSPSYSTGMQADAFGVYTIGDLPAGPYDVTASAPGFLSTTVTVGLTAGAPTTQDLVLEVPGEIQGTLLDAGGAGVQNVTVTATQDGGSGWGSALTGIGGAFTITDLPPGTYTVVASVGGGVNGVTTTFSVPVIGGVTATPTLQLDAGGRLELTVTDTNGDPVDAAMSLSGGGGPTFSGPVGADGYLLTGPLAPGAYTLTVGPLPGQLAGTVTQGITISNNVTTEVAVTLPDFTGISGTVTRTEETPVGVYGAVVACPAPLDPLINGLCGPVSNLIPTAGGAFALALTPGVTYKVAALYANGIPGIPVASSPSTEVTVASGEVATCTFATGPNPEASCAVAPPPPTGTVVVQVDEPAGQSYYPGFCAAPGRPVLGNTTCTDGRLANILWLVPGATSTTVELPTGDYWAGMANQTVTVGSPTRLVTVTEGATLTCSFTLANGPVCDGGDDGDGVAEPPAYDGNGDGTFDDQQPHVTSFDAVGGDTVTLVAPGTTYTLADVTASPAPSDPAPPGDATLPLGVFGFSVVLPAGVTSADVTLLLPPGTNPDSYLKLQDGAWIDFTASGGATVTGDTVVLHLVDGGAGDADGLVNGIIVDPGGPAVTTTSYRFEGFRSPIDGGAVNTAKAGQTIPVKWRITDANGVPISDPASFVSVTSQGTGCSATESDAIETSSGSSGLQYLGDGVWQFNWKTPKGYAGQCRLLSLNLADGAGARTAEFKFK